MGPQASYGASKPPLSAQRIAGHARSNGIVAAWWMREGGGATLRDETGRYPLAFSGGVSWIADSLGIAPKFNGSTGYASTSSNISAFEPGAPWTILVGFVPLSLSATAYAYSCYNNVAGKGFGIRSSAIGQLNGVIGSGSNTVLVGSSLTAGVRVDAALSYDGTSGRLYQGGQLVAGPTTCSYVQNLTDDLYIGAQYNGTSVGSFLNGVVEYAVLYSRALSSAEIKDAAVRPFGVFAPVSPRFWSLPATGTSWSQSCSETLTLTDALTRGEAKSLAETVVLIDACARACGKALSEVCGLSDTVARACAKALSETLALSDVHALLTGKLLADALALSDQRALAISKALAETLGLTDAVAEVMNPPTLSLIVTTYAAAVDAYLRGAGADDVTDAASADDTDEAGGIA